MHKESKSIRDEYVKVQPIHLTSGVTKHRKPRGEHDENGEKDAEKCRVRCWDGVALATGTLPTCQWVRL
jgi:hypothetical protein